VGAGSGVVLMLLAVYVISLFVPALPGMESPLARLLFALQMNVFAVLPLFAMIACVGNERFLSDAIDPLKHKENREMEVDGRVVENTLQQNFVFFVATLALSTVLPPAQTGVLVALTIVFVIARLAFWFGYRKNPLYRAPGMAATAYMNLGILVMFIFLFLS
jgi:hypothetical protein